MPVELKEVVPKWSLLNEFCLDSLGGVAWRGERDPTHMDDPHSEYEKRKITLNIYRNDTAL